LIVGVNYMPDAAPDPGVQDRADIAAGVATAAAAVQVAQQESAAFMAAYGSDVVGGHSPVNAPGRQGDPDTPMPDAADPG
jgi:hypothetical protein